MSEMPSEKVWFLHENHLKSLINVDVQTRHKRRQHCEVLLWSWNLIVWVDVPALTARVSSDP
jgi:hypothetical protein